MGIKFDIIIKNENNMKKDKEKEEIHHLKPYDYEERIFCIKCLIGFIIIYFICTLIIFFYGWD